MKVLQVTYVYHPDPVGGTEIYVESMARVLQQRGLGVTIAAPRPIDASYEHDGLAARRFAGSEDPDLQALYGAGDPRAAQAFGRLLDREPPDIVHLHAYSSAVSLAVVREVRARGLPVVFTYHTPAVACLRGSLLRWGNEICSGGLRAEPCAACSLHGLGLPRSASRLLAAIPPPLGRAVGRTGLSARPITALRMSDLVSSHHRAVGEMLREVDSIVILCDWARDLLVLNGIDSCECRDKTGTVGWVLSG